MQCIAFPTHLIDAIVEDVQELVWSKEAHFDPDEYGTDSSIHRWMKAAAQHGNRTQDLGIEKQVGEGLFSELQTHSSNAKP